MKQVERMLIRMLSWLLIFLSTNHVFAQPFVFQKYFPDLTIQKTLLFPDDDYFIQAHDSGYINKYLFRFDKQNGNLKWSGCLNDTSIPSQDCSQDMVFYLITDNQTLVGVKSYECFSSLGNLSFTSEFFECDTNGNIRWSNSSTDIYHVCAMYDLHDGRYIFFGSLDLVMHNGEPIYGLIDSTGQIVELKKINAPSVRSFFDVIQTSDNGYAATGRYYNGTNYDALFMKFDSAMNCQFAEYMDLGGEDYILNMDELNDRSFVFSSIHLGSDTSFIVHLDQSGHSLTSLRIHTALYSLFVSGMDSSVYIPITTSNPWQVGEIKMNSQAEIEWVKPLSDSTSAGPIWLTRVLKGSRTLLISAYHTNFSQLYVTDSARGGACINGPILLSSDTITPLVTYITLTSLIYGNSAVTPLTLTFLSFIPHVVDTCFGALSDIPGPESNARLFEIFPNPVHGNFTLNYTQTIFSKLKLKIIDLPGKVIVQKDLGYCSPGTYQFSFNTAEHRLENGIYLVEIENASKTETRKLIVSGQ